MRVQQAGRVQRIKIAVREVATQDPGGLLDKVAFVLRIKADADKFRKENPAFTGPIPADLLTSSGSGLDPHISPASAYAQAARVAGARGVAEDQIRGLVAAAIEHRQLGFLGEPRVNVLKLNLELDSIYPLKR